MTSSFTSFLKLSGTTSRANSTKSIQVMDQILADSSDMCGAASAAAMGKLLTYWQLHILLVSGRIVAPLGYTHAGRHAASHRYCVTGLGSTLMKRLPGGSKIY